ncbi:MAG TPA: hypothetical protein ENG69_02175 [Candidatus Korarchaeota archaeon]|nr:hypothetical protein [Candidatus Korarchaeota archaeon]
MSGSPQEERMEVSVERDGDLAIIRVKGETYTLLDPLVKALHEIGVDFAGYDIPHPLKEEGVLYVRCKDEDPVRKVFEAIRRLKEVYGELRDSLQSELERVESM